MITCGGQRTWESNTGIQRLVVSVFYDLGPVASVWGNLGLIVGVFLVHALAATVAPRVSSSWTATRLRFPSHSYVVFLFLLPGVLFSAVGCLHPTNLSSRPSHIASGVLGIVLSVMMFGAACRHVALHVWPSVRISSTRRDYGRLPPWLMKVFGSLLPTVKWRPKSLQARYASCFSAVAARRHLPLQPFLHVHGAIFAMIAGIAFPPSVCSVQYTLLGLWLVVPAGLLLATRLSLLRRPTSNMLSFLAYLFSLCVVVSTAVLTEGPVALRSGAATSVSVFGYMLAAVNVLKSLSIGFQAAVDACARHDRKGLSSEQSESDGENDRDNNAFLAPKVEAPWHDCSTIGPTSMSFSFLLSEGETEPHSTPVSRLLVTSVVSNESIHIRHRKLSEQIEITRLDNAIWHALSGDSCTHIYRDDNARQRNLKTLLTRAMLAAGNDAND